MSTYYKNTLNLDNKYVLPTLDQFMLNLYLKLTNFFTKTIFDIRPKNIFDTIGLEYIKIYSIWIQSILNYCYNP